MEPGLWVWDQMVGAVGLSVLGWPGKMLSGAGTGAAAGCCQVCRQTGHQ